MLVEDIKDFPKKDKQWYRREQFKDLPKDEKLRLFEYKISITK